MSENKFVTDERAKHIEHFGELLGILCKKMQVEIFSETGIGLIDHGRVAEKKLPPGEFFEASFEGCDHVGGIHNGYKLDHGREYCTIEIANWIDAGQANNLQQMEPRRPPTVDEVLAAGYTTPGVAEDIVAEEQGAFDRGEKPYGENPRTGKIRPNPQVVDPSENSSDDSKIESSADDAAPTKISKKGTGK